MLAPYPPFPGTKMNGLVRRALVLFSSGGKSGGRLEEDQPPKTGWKFFPHNTNQQIWVALLSSTCPHAASQSPLLEKPGCSKGNATKSSNRPSLLALGEGKGGCAIWCQSINLLLFIQGYKPRVLGLSGSLHHLKQVSKSGRIQNIRFPKRRPYAVHKAETLPIVIKGTQGVPNMVVKRSTICQ